MSRTPGCVVPGPFGGDLDVLGGIVRMGCAEVVDVADAEGPRVDAAVAGDGQGLVLGLTAEDPARPGKR